MRIRPILRSVGVIGAFIFTIVYSAHHEITTKEKTKAIESKPAQSLVDSFGGLFISSYANYPNQLASYRFIDPKGGVVTSDVLRQKGIQVKSRGACEALLVKGEEYVSVYCH